MVHTDRGKSRLVTAHYTGQKCTERWYLNIKYLTVFTFPYRVGICLSNKQYTKRSKIVDTLLQHHTKTKTAHDAANRCCCLRPSTRRRRHQHHKVYYSLRV